MTRKLQDSVVVITGASSGIGRATALEFARKGATVVLAARSEQALQEAAAECERLGARALAVPTDVTDEAAVQALAQAALGSFGHVDVWVNNAAVASFGRFEETPIADYRRVLEINIFGYVYGARAALPIFRQQGGGVLINVSSIVALATQPYTSPYVMSKAAVRTFGMSLRQELTLEGTKNIHVCTVMPATIDTPFFQHAANYTGRATKAMPPVYPVERVAKTIVGLAQRPKREVMVGNAGRMLGLIRTISPALAERMMATQVDKTHLYLNKPQEPTSGNLWEPMPEYDKVSGGWTAGGLQEHEAAPRRRFGLIGLAALAIPAALLLWWRRQQRVQQQTLPEQILQRGVETLGTAAKILPTRQRSSNGVMARSMEMLGAATKVLLGRQRSGNGSMVRGADILHAVTDLLPRRRQTLWSRISQRALR